MSRPTRFELTPAPPLLLAAGLLTWGWQADYLPYAVIMAVLLELPHVLHWRVNLSDKDFNQLSDLSSLIFAAVVIYIFSMYSVHGVFKILELIPFLFFLLILPQQYSRQGKIKLSALFLSMRKLNKITLADYPHAIDISLPYILICLLAASTGNKEQQLFFIILCLFFLLILRCTRPKHYSVLCWSLPLLLAFSLSFLMQDGLKTLQTLMEQHVAVWFDQFFWRSRDLHRTTTAIGSLGRLKLSDRVTLRLKSKAPLSAPLLLHEATYNAYQYGVWSNTYTDFEDLDKAPDQSHWVINQRDGTGAKITLALYFENDFGVLSAPHGTATIAGDTILTVSRNQFNSIKVESKSGWVHYHIDYAGGNPAAIMPVEADLAVPDNYRDDFKRLAASLNLDNLSPREVITTVQSFFAEGFYYSITQNQRYPKSGYLTNFLFKDRKGHCEYFATATTLLLRTAGVPARYAVGFSAHEYSQWQQMYIVRARDAHSWTTFYLEGEWHSMDTTPSVWAAMEAEDRSILEGWFDVASWLGYVLWSDDSVESEQNKYDRFLLLLLIPFMVFLFRRLRVAGGATATQPAKVSSNHKDRHGADSAFSRLIIQLEKTAGKRNSGETLPRWLVRILPNAAHLNDYLHAVKLHYQYRFGRQAGDHMRAERDRQSEHILGSTTKARQ